MKREVFAACLGLAAAIGAGGAFAESSLEALRRAADVPYDSTQIAAPAAVAVDSPGADFRRRAARFPIVLAHGYCASPRRGGFEGVAKALSADGHQTHESEVPPFDGTAVRARFLAAEIDRTLKNFKAAKVNIIAHSMGGLDARELISRLGYGDRVASLTTISTPHQGSAMADLILRATPSAADKWLNAWMESLGRKFSGHADDSHLRAALVDISEGNSAQFNQAHPDDPRVYYQSWAGVSTLRGRPNAKAKDACESKILSRFGRSESLGRKFFLNASVVGHGWERRPNDGNVTVASAKWGEFQGCIHADHAREVGGLPMAGENGKRAFDHIRFYRHIARELAAKGF